MILEICNILQHTVTSDVLNFRECTVQSIYCTFKLNFSSEILFQINRKYKSF